MISISNIKSAGKATHYYEKDDYYAKDDPEHKNGSLWHGKGASLLGLSSEVEKEAGIASQTIHKFLFKYNGLIHDRGTEQGRITMRQDMQNTVIIVDESSLASTGQMNALLKVSKALDFKVVLVGDTKQLNAVEAGKPFYQLQKAGMHTAIMGEIKRQKDQTLKSVVYDAINGEIKQATLPVGIKDPDQMIKERGIEVFKMVVAEAKVVMLNLEVSKQPSMPVNTMKGTHNLQELELEK
jgi:hypothetical protein